ncbi:hypothetical protein Tco_0449192 [Tanacetum coccineum]
MKDIIKDKVKSQLPQILPKEVSEFATPVIQSTITESLENVILLDEMQKSKSYQAAQEHRDLYDVLVKSYKLDKDFFESYGKEYSLKRDCEDKDKYEDPPLIRQWLKKTKDKKDIGCRQLCLLTTLQQRPLRYLMVESPSRKYMSSTTKTKALRRYEYKNEEKIKALTSQEGDFPRLNLRDIEDLLLLLVQKKLSNLERDVIFESKWHCGCLPDVLSFLSGSKTFNWESKATRRSSISLGRRHSGPTSPKELYTLHTAILKKLSIVVYDIPTAMKELQLLGLSDIEQGSDLVLGWCKLHPSCAKHFSNIDAHVEGENFEWFKAENNAERPTMFVITWSYKVVRIRYSFPQSSQKRKDLPRDISLVSVEVLSHLEPSDAMHQQDWVQDTDEELEDRELEAHYVYMAKIQEATLVVDEDTGPIFDKEPLEKVHPNDDYNVFVTKRQHLGQLESINDKYVLEKVDSNITPDSSNMCNYEGKVDHDTAQEKERALLASLIQNMKLEIDESKRVIKV